MKIGIVTWYKNGNYGGTLQAYALSTILKEKRHSIEFINYHFERNFIKMISKKIKSIIFLILYPIEYLSRKRIYKFVNKNLNETVPIYNYSKLISYAKCYDYVICGSDQIWSFVNGFDKYYFLDFVDKNKRISYAPSIGYNQVANNYQKEFIKYISEFNELSIREKKGQEIIEELCKKKAKVVLDPSLLISKEQWEQFSKNSKKKTNKKFILCYFLENNTKYTDYAERLKEKTGFDLIYVSTKKMKCFNLKNKRVCGIEDFVYYIKNAEYILTDSFHGLAFSINLNKKFAIFKRFDDNNRICQNSRIYNLLDLTSFDDYPLDPESEVDYLINKRFDYISTNKRIKEERDKSLKFLFNALDNK